MYHDRFEIISYIIHLGPQIKAKWGQQDIRAQGMIECKGKEGTIVFYFVSEPGQYTALVNTERKTAVAFPDIRQMPVYTDLLRNEKPIFGYVNSEFPNSTLISTSLEAVGEGE